MTIDEMQSRAVKMLAESDPDLAGRIMWRVQDGRLVTTRRIQWRLNSAAPKATCSRA